MTEGMDAFFEVGFPYYEKMRCRSKRASKKLLTGNSWFKKPGVRQAGAHGVERCV
jgi:hypothetical protein